MTNAIEDFWAIEEVENVYYGTPGAAQYIDLSTTNSLNNKEPHRPPHSPSKVRIVHGSGLSLYFLTQAQSNKSVNIQADPRVSGSILVPPPKPGEGVSVFFYGIAHQLSLDGEFPSFASKDIDERTVMMTRLCVDRDDYAQQFNQASILAEETDLRLFRIVLTEAWYNGGVCEEGSNLEINATRPISFVMNDGNSILTRRMVDSQLPLSKGSTETSPENILRHLGMSA